MGSRHTIKLIQVFQPILEFNLFFLTTKMEMGVLEFSVTFMLGRGHSMDMLRKTRWILKEEGKTRPPSDECPPPTPFHSRTMNIIIWNSRDVLKPNFQSYFGDLSRDHDPALFVVMETRLGGDRAKAITDRLPFDGAIHTNTIGYAGGLWLLWNLEKVEVSLLSKTE